MTGSLDTPISLSPSLQDYRVVVSANKKMNKLVKYRNNRCRQTMTRKTAVFQFFCRSEVMTYDHQSHHPTTASGFTGLPLFPDDKRLILEPLESLNQG